jgi:hypothetical protein
VTIPGHLFASAKGTEAQLDTAKTLGTRFLEVVEGAVEGVELPTGTWRLTARGTGPLQLSARRQSDGAAATRVPDGVELRLDERGRVAVAVVGGSSAFLTEVVARRTGD